MILEEANGIAFWPWITLELGFQNWNFCQKIEFCQWSSCAVFRLVSIRSWSGLCMEWIRSKNLIKILCIHGLEDLIFQDLFSIFSMLFCTNHDQFSSILSIFDYARIFEPITCTKRFDKLGLVFSMYLINLNELLIIKIQINK